MSHTNYHFHFDVQSSALLDLVHVIFGEIRPLKHKKVASQQEVSRLMDAPITFSSMDSVF